MSHAAITIEGLSKAYRIGLKDEVPDTLIAAMQGVVRAPLRNWKRLVRLNTFGHNDEAEDLFWALRNVSFEIKEGQVLGVIGRNGAGKSTLLKILSRITEPTAGRATIRGRVSSLLEVGTGFHQELTGRDNIYMNGTILGMTKREIDRKFDEIVDFSGVERFLDTPIKRYSSGMKVRLAFSVAAHLEPEILIIDEVLAVGDAEFQKKCMGKMQDVASGGRTILFVSHNLPAIRSLTHACAYMVNGSLRRHGPTAEVADAYFSDAMEAQAHAGGSVDAFRNRGSHGSVRFKSIRVDGNRLDSGLTCVNLGQSLTIEFQIESQEAVKSLCLAATISREQEQRVTTILTRDQKFPFSLSPGVTTLTCCLRNPQFSPGRYMIEARITLDPRTRPFDRIRDYPLFEIKAHDASQIAFWPSRPWGAVHLANGSVDWQITVPRDGRHGSGPAVGAMNDGT